MVACMSSLLLSIDLRRIRYFIMFYFKLTNGSMDKCWIFIWCNGEINNRTGHFLSWKYWICLFVLFLNTTSSLINNNKQIFLSYCNTSFFVFFETLRLKNYVNLLSIIAILSPLASCCRCCCWRLVVVVGVSDAAPHCRSGRHQRLVLIDFSLLSAAVSLLVAASVWFCTSLLAASCLCRRQRRHPNQN